jgi:hypothetical protein
LELDDIEAFLFNFFSLAEEVEIEFENVAGAFLERTPGGFTVDVFFE